MLTELIDQRQRLLAEIDEREQALKVLDHDIMFNLLESGEKQAFGTDKTGVALTSTTRYEYGQYVYRYLDSKGRLNQKSQRESWMPCLRRESSAMPIWQKLRSTRLSSRALTRSAGSCRRKRGYFNGSST